MAIVVAGTILVLVLVAVLVCMRRQRPGPERSQVVVNPLSAPPQQEQAQALVGTPGQTHGALQFGRRMAWAWMQVEDGVLDQDQARQALSALASPHAVDWVWQRLRIIQDNS